MPSINPNRYPVDYTGTAPSNLVQNEAVVLATRKVRVFVPAQAPYFTNTMVIKDATSGATLNSTQWKSYYVVQAATALTGMNLTVCVAVAILDQGVSNNLTISYQTVGGDYVGGYDNILQLVQSLTADTRPVTYPNVINAPTAFTPSQHLQSLNNTLGWEYVIGAVEQLKMTILLGDDVKKDAVLNYITQSLASSNAVVSAQTGGGSAFGAHVTSTNNPHNVTPTQLNLGNVQNYGVATLAQVTQTTPPTNLYVTADVVSAAVKNAINLGMDVHIANTSNPHGVTPTQIGLGLVQNYSVATLTELQTPVAGTPRYVTNTVLGQYLTTWFTSQQTSIASSFSTLNASVSSASNTAQSAVVQAQAAQATAAQALSQGNATLAAVQAAQGVADQNAASVSGSVSTVTTYFNTYVAQATSNAYTSGYNAGYAAGLSAK